MVEEVAGVGGAKPHLLTCGGVSVVVSDFEGEQVSVTRENVFAHERVVQQVLAHTTPLPFRFGTLAGRERLEDYVNANQEGLLRVMERVRDSVEMSVKIIWSAADVRHDALEEEPLGEGGGPESGASVENGEMGKGSAYLAARRREILGDELVKKRAEDVAGWLIERVGGAVRERKIDVRPVESLVVRAAFLVQRTELPAFRERLEATRHERAGLRFLTSGPWPPYSFSDINP